MGKKSIYSEFLGPSVFNLIMELEKEAFLGLKGRIRLFLLKKQLYRDAPKKILKKYGREVYYSDLDAFLTKNRVICNILQNCAETSVFTGHGKREVITYYICHFMERHPEYRLYQNEIRRLLQECFEVIFQALNRIHSEELQALCNITRELAFEMTEEIRKVQEIVTRIDKKTDLLAGGTADESTVFSKDKYVEYLLYLYPQYPSDSYLERKLYSSYEKDREEDAAAVVLAERKVILLGEAGFGKTYESVILLNRFCRDERTKELIPVYFSLQEYGVLYSDIAGGIRYKVDPFCKGASGKLTDQWIKEGKFLFIFDGIDDIPEENVRKKFILEANHFLLQYPDNYFFFTSRFNRYHKELGGLKEYFLTALKKDVIREELFKAGIKVNIPENYYQLFSNPLFFEAGKKVLAQSSNYDIFNRSQLFRELFLLLYAGAAKRGKLSFKTPATCSEALHILGKFAYETFSFSSYSYLEFDDRLSEIIETDKTETIAFFISSGIFRVSENVTFFHKLFKEYCAAYHLVKRYPLEKHAALYQELVSREEWKEVFIFIGGMFEDREKQDTFLDFVMAENLPLYVECIRAKSDLLRNDDYIDRKDAAQRLLSQIRKTYAYITAHYFEPIAERFDPQLPEGTGRSREHGKIGIVGWLSDDGSRLSYWLHPVSEEEKEMVCLYGEDMQTVYAFSKEKALKERKNFRSYYINLQRAGRLGDSGRQIAIDLIKSELKKLLEKRQLIESNWLLCERILEDREKIKEIKDSLNLCRMREVIDEWIDQARQIAPNIAGYDYNGIDLFQLQKLLHDANILEADLADYMLPGPDRMEAAEYPCWTWDLYSKEQMEKRLTLFFYYHELSYLDMVVKNFPNLYPRFFGYQDIPYQVIISVDYKENADKYSFYAEPGIHYYHVAAKGEEIPMPVISEYSEISTLEELERILEKTRESYWQKGKTVRRVSYTSVSFSRIAASHLPLTSYVYQSIKESLEEVFGRI